VGGHGNGATAQATAQNKIACRPKSFGCGVAHHIGDYAVIRSIVSTNRGWSSAHRHVIAAEPEGSLHSSTGYA
jgi:hypothetical protein